MPAEQPAATPSRRTWREGDWITCPRCEGQKYDRGSCGLCGNLGVLDENGERFHCDCRADDWVEGDNEAVRCEQCGGYAASRKEVLVNEVRSLAVDVSGEGDFSMHSEDAWRVEAMTPHSVIVVRVEHGQAVVTVNGKEVYRGR